MNYFNMTTKEFIDLLNWCNANKQTLHINDDGSIEIMEGATK